MCSMAHSIRAYITIHSSHPFAVILMQTTAFGSVQPHNTNQCWPRRAYFCGGLLHLAAAHHSTEH